MITKSKVVVLVICVIMLGLVMALGIGMGAARVASAGSGGQAGAAQPKGQPAGECSFTLVPSGNIGPENSLYGVVTLAANNAWAVGNYDAGDDSRTLIEHWNGTSWSIVPSPNPSSTVNSLVDVTAVAANDVWAVGYYIRDGESVTRTLIEHWNGTSWSVVPSPNQGAFRNQLRGVTAVAANDVWAVGDHENLDGTTEMLIEHWNGVTWDIVPGPSEGTIPQNTLYDVTAVAANDVWAVGAYYDESTPSQTLVLHWSGTAWSIVPSPNMGSDPNTLTGVAAVSANDVWAVGYALDVTNPSTLVLHWNGTAWSIMPSPNPSPNPSPINILYSVTAVAANDVWAVGFYLNSQSEFQALVEHWNGSTWNVVPSAELGQTSSIFAGVSASGPGDIWAVGYAQDPGSGNVMQRTLTERWNGTEWSVAPSPNPGVIANALNGVSAVSASDIWAVGYTIAPVTEFDTTLIEHWDGTAWSIVPSPNVGPTNNKLLDVAAVAANDVWAVGHSYDGALIEHWDGTAWSIVPNPSSGSLEAVVAVSANDVWAVGSSTNGTLVEHWDGTAWSIVPSPNQGTGRNELIHVTAISANDVWAVGLYENAGGIQQTLIEHWDGTIWSIVPSPNVGAGFNILLGVSAVSANDVWAVGYYVDAGNIGRALALRWNGTEWSVVPGPNVGQSDYYALIDVVAVGANDVWAVGIQRSGNLRTLAAHWDGTEWSAVASPSPGSSENYLWAVTAVGANDVWAVGYHEDTNSVPQTLVTRYTCEVACTVQFTDVPEGHTFYPFVRCMACQGIINGYPCGGAGEPCNPTNDPYFRPNNNVMRGQIAKIVALASGNQSPVDNQTFEDVLPGSTFYTFTEQLVAQGVMNGYSCGGPGEPCVAPANRPYFRPSSTATRGQLSKIDANAASFNDIPSGQQFEDVLPGSTFYTFTYQLATRNIMSGYACGGSGEPCVAPGNRPYFRPGSNVTRGQTSKIVGNTFFPDCQIP